MLGSERYRSTILQSAAYSGSVEAVYVVMDTLRTSLARRDEVFNITFRVQRADTISSTGITYRGRPRFRFAVIEEPGS